MGFPCIKKNLVLKTIVWAGLILTVAAGCAIPFFFESPSMFYKFGSAKLLLRTGKILGILAGVLLMFQLVWVGRFFFLDRIFGQDKLIGFHRGFAMMMTAAAFFHPVFVLWAENFTLYPLTRRYWPEFSGVVLLVLIICTTLVSVFRIRFRLAWNRWSRVHQILAPLMVTVFFIHVLNVSKPFATGLPHRALLLAGLFSLGGFARQWTLKMALFKKKFQVVSVMPAARDAWAVDARPLSGPVFPYRPGQFAYVIPLGKKIAQEEHPFTIASCPSTADHLQFVIRACGDFTGQIKDLEPGDTLLIDGPYGRFSHVFLDEKTPVIMIAGGIGITPMLSMLRWMAHFQAHRKVLLIWSNKTRAHIVFDREILDLSQKIAHFCLFHVITQDTANPGKSHRINRENLSEMLGGHDRNSAVFVCGPPGMVVTVKHGLNKLGFSRSRVYTESFVL